MRRKRQTIRHEFVEFVPDQLVDGTLYVSLTYATAVHQCFCGCGRRVVTPLSPTDWELSFDGKSVSLYPSIGSWALPCRSHYWITENEVEWAGTWSREQIDAERKADRLAKDRYFRRRQMSKAAALPEPDSKTGSWERLQAWIARALG